MNFVGWVENTTSTSGQMVIWAEDKGKFTSSRLVNTLGTKSLPKWGGMCKNESPCKFPFIWYFLDGKIGVVGL